MLFGAICVRTGDSMRSAIFLWWRWLRWFLGRALHCCRLYYHANDSFTHQWITCSLCLEATLIGALIFTGLIRDIHLWAAFQATAAQNRKSRLRYSSSASGLCRSIFNATQGSAKQPERTPDPFLSWSGFHKITNNHTWRTYLLFLLSFLFFKTPKSRWPFFSKRVFVFSFHCWC